MRTYTFVFFFFFFFIFGLVGTGRSHGQLHVGEALNLVSPFKADRKEVSAFISNVDTAFGVRNPDNAGVLYKFVLTRISGEPRVAITHRNLENLDDLRELLKNTYTEKRTLEFHAMRLFGAKQGKNGNISEWIKISNDLVRSLERQLSGL